VDSQELVSSGPGYFVEAYLNGIAFDYYYRNEPKLNDKEKKDLMEWDFQTSRRVFVNFERKVLDYQKIILGLQHPQIMITSSKNLRLILGEAKELRDSIVHQSPKTDDAFKVSKKVLWMLALRIGHVAEIVDAAIGVVKELNYAFGKDGMPLNWHRPLRLLWRGRERCAPSPVWHSQESGVPKKPIHLPRKLQERNACPVERDPGVQDVFALFLPG
jgi:hypothetical protein